MSNKINLSIYSLPVELLYRIFDDLDTKTILFSIRPVSRLFQSLVNTYDRYVFDLKLISKPNFPILCRLINPRNVISLTLLNGERTSNQIDFFISLVHLQEFTRLHSLTLLNIDEFQLNFILKRINLNRLTSFSFSIRKHLNRCKKTTLALFSSVLIQSTLRKLEFKIKDIRISEISWPVNCTIQYLVINDDINVDDLCKLLQSSPHLHTLFMMEIPKRMINKSSSICFRQLMSLTIKDLRVTIDELELFLLLTPSLVYLKLIGGRKMMDGKRWEHFIQINLLNLNKFEFYFIEMRLTRPSLTDLKSMISSFQTPFWTEYKKWFVTCECNNNGPITVDLYSLPFYISFLKYTPISQKISASTNTMIFDADSTIMDNINSLDLSLSTIVADDIQNKKTMTNHPMFPKVNKINLIFEKEWPLLSLHSLSVYINISQIVQMKLQSHFLYRPKENIFYKYNKTIWMDIGIFLKQAYNLSTLSIIGSPHRCSLNQTIGNICSIIPSHVQHLQMPINNVDQTKQIVEQCPHLSTLHFDVQYIKNVNEITKWFANNTINSTCCKQHRVVTVWLGRRQIESTEISVDPKRIKLTDSNSNS